MLWSEVLCSVVECCALQVSCVLSIIVLNSTVACCAVYSSVVLSKEVLCSKLEPVLYSGMFRSAMECCDFQCSAVLQLWEPCGLQWSILSCSEVVKPSALQCSGALKPCALQWSILLCSALCPAVERSVLVCSSLCPAVECFVLQCPAVHVSPAGCSLPSCCTEAFRQHCAKETRNVDRKYDDFIVVF